MVAKGEQESAMPNLYKRGETWWARFKVCGVEYRRSLRTSVRSEAERRLGGLRKQIEGEARFGVVEPRTFAAAAESWKQHCTRDLSVKTVQRYLTSLKQVWPQLAHLHVHTIDVPKLRELEKVRRIGGATTATIRRDLTAISMVLRHAADEEWMEEINPTLAFRSKRTMREKRDPITLPADADIAAVKAKAPERFADTIDFARETGMREEEIFSLTHRMVQGDQIVIKGKHNRLRVIPLSRKASRIIDKQPQHIGSQFVFWHGEGKRYSSPAARFQAIRRSAEKAAHKAAQDFHRFRFHDLRHLFAVEYLRAKRGSLYDLQMILGHSSVTTTEIYLDHLTPEQRKAAMHGATHKAAHV
jgi:integrase/recombinase XerD